MPSRIGEALRTDRPLTWDPDRQGSLFETVDPQATGAVVARKP